METTNSFSGARSTTRYDNFEWENKIEISHHGYKISHHGYERELVLIHLVGGDVGDFELSRKTCREMLQVIAYHRRQQARDYLQTPNLITGKRKRHVGASIDKQTDDGGKR